MVGSLRNWETCGNTVALKALTGTATLSYGLKAKALLLQSEHNVESLALNAMGQDQLLEDWELARVALSCHMALDLLCQEMHETWELRCCCEGALCRSKKCPSLTVDALSQRRRGLW